MALEPTEANLASLANVLRATLSGDNATINAATTELSGLESRAGYSLCLLQLIALPSLLDQQVKQAASIAFKNFVLNKWADADGDGTTSTISQHDRGLIKQHLLQLMVSAPRKIQQQLSQSVAIIAQHDFPNQWTNLLPELASKMEAGSVTPNPSIKIEELLAVLEVQHSIYYRYRHETKSNALWSEIKVVLEAVATPLSKLFQVWIARLGDANLVQSKDGLTHVVKVLGLCLDLFYSLNVQEHAAEFDEVPIMQLWLGGCLELLKFDAPVLEPNVPPAQQEDATILDTLKVTISDICNLFTWKYESAFAEWVPRFVETIWSLLTKLSEARRFDVVVSGAVKFLASVARKAQFKHLFANEAALQAICDKVIIPQLRLRESDLELFEFNSQEYIRVDIEGSDVDTRRRNVRDFVHALLQHFEQVITNMLKGYVQTLLEEYEKNKGKKNAFVAKDVAMYIILALSAKTSSVSKGVTATNPYIDLNSFLSNHVLSELSGDMNANPILKADCLKFLTVFRAQLPKEYFSQLMQLIMTYLSSQQVVLHTYAAYAIERLLSVKEPSATPPPPAPGAAPTVSAPAKLRYDKDALAPHLQKLMESLFKVLQHEESKENEYVMKAIMRCCSVGQDAMVPFASEIITRITAILSYVCQNPRNPKFNHSMFETIAALIKFLCKSNPGLVDNFESALFGPFQSLLGMESAADFSPYVFQLLAQLLEIRPDISAPYQSIFPALLAPAVWKNTGNVPAVTRLLCAYLRKPSTASTLLNAASGGGNPLEGILGIFQQLIRARSNEVYAFDLLTCIITAVELDRIGKYIPGVFSGMVFPKLQPAAKPSARTLKCVTGMLLAFVATRGLERVMAICDQVQPGIFTMLYGQIILPNVHFLHASDVERKLGAVTLTHLACSSVFLSNPALQSHWARTILEAVKLLLPKTSKSTAEVAAAIAAANGLTEEDADSEDLLHQSEAGFSTAYAKLVFAATPGYDYAATITNQQPKDYFVQQINTLFAQHPGKLLPQLNSLPSPDQHILTTFFNENQIKAQ